MFKSPLKTSAVIYQSLLVMFLIFAQASVASETSHKTNGNGKFEAFFNAYVDGLNSRDEKVVSDSIDIDAIFDTAIESKSDKKRYEKTLTNKFKSEFKASFISSLLTNMADEGFARLIKLGNSSKNQSKALIRIILPSGGAQYLDVTAVSSKGKVKIVDWFDYSMGQTLTTNVTSILDMVVPRSGFIGKIRDIADDKGRVARAFKDLAEIKRNPDLTKAKKFFSDYKKYMEDNWILMTVATQLMAVSSDEKFNLEILSFMDKHYADDTRAGFLLFDYYFVTNQFDKVIASLNRYEKEFAVEEGGILNFKVITYYQAGDLASALKTTKRCIAVEPSFEQCYWLGVTVAIELKDFTEAIDILNMIVNDLGYEFSHDNIAADPMYADFVKSKEYANWEYIQKTKSSE